MTNKPKSKRAKKSKIPQNVGASVTSPRSNDQSSTPAETSSDQVHFDETRDDETTDDETTRDDETIDDETSVEPPPTKKPKRRTRKKHKKSKTKRRQDEDSATQSKAGGFDFSAEDFERRMAELGMLDDTNPLAGDPLASFDARRFLRAAGVEGDIENWFDQLPDASDSSDAVSTSDKNWSKRLEKRLRGGGLYEWPTMKELADSWGQGK